MAVFTWRDRLVVSEAVVGGEGCSEKVTVIRSGVMETLLVLSIIPHFVPLTAGQIAAFCWSKHRIDISA